MDLFASGAGADGASGFTWSGGVNNWTKTVEDMQKRATEKLQKKAAEVQAATGWKGFPPGSLFAAVSHHSPSEVPTDPEVMSTLDGAGPAAVARMSTPPSSLPDRVSGKTLQQQAHSPNSNTLAISSSPAGPALPLAGGTPSLQPLSSSVPSSLASHSSKRGSGSADSVLLSPTSSDSATRPDSTTIGIAAECGEKLSQQRPADDPGGVPDLWMRPLPVPAPAMSTARMSAATSDDGNAENEGVEEAQARVSMGDEEQPLETEQERESDNETHERLLTLAARKGAKLAALLRKIHSSSVSRQFPLPETPGHPSAASILAVGGGRGANVEGAEAVGGDERNSGRLRDAVCEAAAKGLNLFISGSTPSMSADGSRGDGTPKSSVSGASTSPEGLASVPSSGPGSSPASTTDALGEGLLSPSAKTEAEHNGCFTELAPQSVTPGRQSHPTADETWSQILKPVTTRLEAKVSSMREGAMTDLNKMLHALPEGSQARQSANSVLDMLGESVNKAVRRRQTVVTSEGHVYEGFVNDDGHVLRHGYGRLTWPDGHWFQGEFRGGETCGLGRRAWPTGHAFSGMEDKGAKHGLGVYTWPDSRRYEGEFRFDVKDGVGFMRWPNGRCYLGEWKQGLQNGDGIEWRADGYFLTVYEAGRLVCDTQAPPALEGRLADIAAAASIIPRCTQEHMQQQTSPKAGGGDESVARAGDSRMGTEEKLDRPEEFFLDTKALPSSLGQIARPSSCGSPSSAAANAVSRAFEDNSRRPTYSPGGAAVGAEAFTPGGGHASGRRRGAARETPRHVHTPGTEDDEVGVKEEEEAMYQGRRARIGTAQGKNMKSDKGWHLKVIHGEVVAILDSMSDPESSFAAPAATPEVVEVGDDSGAIAPLLSADLVRGEESGMKGQDLTGCGGARRNLFDPVPRGEVPGLSSSDVKVDRGSPLVNSAVAITSVEKESGGGRQAGDSGGSSFDVSPSSTRSVSSDNSSLGEQSGGSGIRRILNFAGGGSKMDRIVELLQGGVVGDMVEEDGEVGLAEQLAGESEQHLLREARGEGSAGGGAGPSRSGSSAGSLRSRASGGPVSPSWPKTPGSRRSVSEEPELADPQYPSRQLKSASKLHHCDRSGGSTCTTPTSQASGPSALGVDSARASPPPHLLTATSSRQTVQSEGAVLGACAGHAETAAEIVDANQSDDEMEEEQEVLALKATQQLWEAVIRGDDQVLEVRAALAGGARVDWLDAEDRGNCALHKAAEYGASGLVSALLCATGVWGRGAAPSSRNAYNDTPLHAAAFKGHLSIVDMLIDAQADVNARSDDGESPLHMAAFGGHAEVCEALLRGGAQVDAIAVREGDTPLHLAVLGSHVAVVRALLVAHARTDLRNKDDCTALELADIQQSEDISDMLRDCSESRSRFPAPLRPNTTFGAPGGPTNCSPIGIPTTCPALVRTVSGDLILEAQGLPSARSDQSLKPPGAQV